MNKDGAMDDSSEDRRMQLGENLDCTPIAVAIAMAIVSRVKLV
jgi:hypothetical protein